jgi:hypothetical protein
VRVFDRNLAIGSHACSIEASRRVTNGIPLGCPPLLLVGSVNSIQTLKAVGCWAKIAGTQCNPVRYCIMDSAIRSHCPLTHRVMPPLCCTTLTRNRVFMHRPKHRTQSLSEFGQRFFILRGHGPQPLHGGTEHGKRVCTRGWYRIARLLVGSQLIPCFKLL